jgi:hypothetical protein
MTTERRKTKLFPGVLFVAVGAVPMVVTLAQAQSTRPKDPRRGATLADPGAVWFFAGMTGLMAIFFVLGGIGAILRPDLIQTRS